MSNKTGSLYEETAQNATLSYQPDHIQGPVRKKMRKGTKSCLECRRRKIKCTFEPGRVQICNECHARGSACIDQEHGDIQVFSSPQTVSQSPQSLRDRVATLEGLVRQVLTKLPDAREGATATSSSLLLSSSSSSRSVDSTGIDAQAAEVLKSLRTSNRVSSPPPPADGDILPDGVHSDAPSLTLFDNAVIQREQSEPTFSRAQYNKNRTLLAALTRMLPSAHDLGIILEASHEWWVAWRRQVYPEITDERCESIKESVSHSLRSDKPAQVASVMVCIAISLHQMPDDFDWSQLQLSESRSQLMDKYISAVDKLIIADDEVAATIEGIECIVLTAKYHINMGRPRRSWLLCHRAIAFCQLLGIHRLPNQPDHSDPAFRRSIGLWGLLVRNDRILALFLGIPYTVPDAFCRALFGPNSLMLQYCSSNDGETYMCKLLHIITKMIDRNQSPVSLPYSATMYLDQELDELQAAQDPSWWTTEKLPGQSVKDHFDHLQAQMFHYEAKVLLHMPFMLRSSTKDTRYHYSHSSALDGARHMIRYYSALRAPLTGPYICKLIDFQAFTAAMLLLLNLCGYASASRTTQQHPHDLEQDQHDSTLIDTTIGLLRGASKELGGAVAAQSVQALEFLAQARQGCSEGAECSQRQNCQVSIPYFGTIAVARGKSFVPIKPGTYPKAGGGEPRRFNSHNPNPVSTVNPSGLPTPPSIASLPSAQPSPLPSKNPDPHTTNTNTHAHTQTHQPPPPPPPPQPQPPQIQRDTSDLLASSATAFDHQSWDSNLDPFITFDAFMALPPNTHDHTDNNLNHIPVDFSASGSYSATTSSTAPSAAAAAAASSFTPQPSYDSTTTPTNNNDSSTNDAGITGPLGPVSPPDNNAQPGFPFTGFPFTQASSNIDLDQGWNWFGLDTPPAVSHFH